MITMNRPKEREGTIFTMPYPGSCTLCHGEIKVGEKVEWVKVFRPEREDYYLLNAHYPNCHKA